MTVLPVTGDCIPDKPPAASLLRSWLAVLSVAVGAFAFVTSEFLPVGLLTRIAADLGVTAGEAGQMVTMPGILGAIAAPLLTVAAGRLDRRLVLCLLTALAIVSNVIVAMAPNLTLLLAGRILLGISIGGFWSFAVSLGLRLVHTASAERATALILAGISLGTVCGVPAGAMIGEAFGWRFTFVLAALLSGIVLAVQITCLPPLPPLKLVKARDLLALFGVTQARLGLIAIALTITGHFAAYTNLRPLLEEIARLSPSTITLVLVTYGVTGIIGNFLGGMLVARNVRAGLLTTVLMLATALLLTAAFGTLPTATMLLVGVWGLAFGAVPVSVQTWMFKAAPDALESGSAILVSTFQVSIASGALFGGLVVDGFGVAAAMLLGGALALAAAGVVILFLGEARGEASGKASR